MKFSAINPTPFLLAGAAVVVAYLVYRGARAGADVVVESLDPTDRSNIFNRGFNELTESPRGDSVGERFAEHCVENGFPWYCPKVESGVSQ